jgi:hypothetical protein
LFDTGLVTNSGDISAASRGIFLQNGEVTNTSAGTIFGFVDGVKTAGALVSNAGTITGGVRINIDLASSGTSPKSRTAAGFRAAQTE